MVAEKEINELLGIKSLLFKTKKEIKLAKLSLSVSNTLQAKKGKTLEEMNKNLTELQEKIDGNLKKIIEANGRG